ncbi:hypothetical protein ACFV9C_44605 [Kribbella sp. NPDC059898]|uniref:hypothetical protein n=1 Tax=Kribbella sp. NPDC059898 TaxID=3346995 RepID=UPI003647FC55
MRETERVVIATSNGRGNVKQLPDLYAAKPFGHEDRDHGSTFQHTRAPWAEQPGRAPATGVTVNLTEIGRRAYRNGETRVAADSQTGRQALMTLPSGSQAAAAREYAEGWRAEQQETNPVEYLTELCRATEDEIAVYTEEIRTTRHKRRLTRLERNRSDAREKLSRLATELGSAVQDQRRQGNRGLRPPEWLLNDLGAHRPTGRTELGYTRRVCNACDADWPCPETVQARENWLLQEQAAYEHAPQKDSPR